MPSRKIQKKSEILATTGTRLRQIRLEQGFRRQEDFGKFLGEWGHEAISRYERDETSPPTDLLVALIEKCHIDINWLLTGEGPRTMQTGENNEWEEVSRIRDNDVEVVVRRRRAAEEKAVAEAVHRDRDRQIEILSLPKAHREQRPAASEIPSRQIKTKKGAKNCRGSRP